VEQVGLRARRLGLAGATLAILAETSVEAVIAAAEAAAARVLVVDSIQTMASADVEASAGSVSQLRESAARFVAFAKQTGTAVVLIGHVTKEGVIAGPRVLEHLVDTVLYFESDAGSRFRVVRAIKNRFGAANEIGVFAMDEHGLREVKNPSAIFLSRHETPVPGSIVTVTREGTRPMLIEVQALVDDSRAQLPRRVAIGIDTNRLSLLLAVLAETGVEAVLAAAGAAGARLLVVDSIQTMASTEVEASPGSVSQLRESAARFVEFAKRTGTAVVLIGHVTKEGVIAGPRVLEHLVDTVLYFESDAGSRFRVVRAVKNRFGAAQEIGVFAMEEGGLREVRNPSAIFLSRHPAPVAGSVVTVAREGTRPLLIEVQALVDESPLQMPRRVALGLDASRLALLLAVLHRHAGIALAGHDVFVNVVGGVRLGETAADLPALLATVSSLEDRPLATELVAFGELGLAGEIRPVPYGEERLREAAKHGFRRALVPRANAPRKAIDGLEVVAVARLDEALAAAR
ncbi:MAG TPA: DNA repair protein RadA, partial [Steroidobacteraceae bacterium]|nr:DNA repair protein RadA [Steroidobacteraceae bacterium]